MKAVKLMAAVFAVTIGNVAVAYEAGDWLVRGRIVNVSPNDDSGELFAVNRTVNLGEGVSVNSVTIPELDFTYMLTPNWGLELILGYSQHDVTTTGAPAAMGLGQVIDAKVLPPTLTLQYHFLPTGTIRPYAGLGLNYMLFFDESVVGVLDQPGAEVELDDSFGFAFQLGVDVAINDDWFVNLDVKYIQADTTATFNNINLVGNAEIDADIDPFVFGVGVGYRF